MPKSWSVLKVVPSNIFIANVVGILAKKYNSFLDAI